MAAWECPDKNVTRSVARFHDRLASDIEYDFFKAESVRNFAKTSQQRDQIEQISRGR